MQTPDSSGQPAPAGTPAHVEEGGDRRRLGRRRRDRAGRGRVKVTVPAPPSARAFERQPHEAPAADYRPVADPEIELTLDLRWTAASRLISRVTTAIDKIAEDVVLAVLLRDSPEYSSVVPQVYQTLRARGYATDTVRLPGGNQRLRATRRRRPAVVPPRPQASPSAADEAGPAAEPATPAPTFVPGEGAQPPTLEGPPAKRG